MSGFGGYSHRNRSHALLLPLLLLLLVGCANAAPAPAVDPRAADVAFARAMIPHHEQGVELSALVPGRATSPVVTDLAFRIDRKQAQEIGQLQGLLRVWGEEPGDGEHGGHAAHGAHTGMLLPGELDRLRGLSGPAFDQAWSEAMVAHHRGAIAMARDLLAATGEDSTLTELARTMIATQEAEVRALLT